MADRDEARTEFNPKYRIVGAIVLVALLVIFVPMILDESEPPPELRNERQPPARAEATDTRVIVTPIPGTEARKETQETASVTVPPPPAPVEEKTKPETPSAEPAEKPMAVRKPEAAPAPAKSAKPAAVAYKPGDAAWVVQVGTFSNMQNATQLRDKLKSMGHAVHAHSITVGGKKLMRLRVGPFTDRSKADRAQAQIRKETGIAGVVQAQS